MEPDSLGFRGFPVFWNLHGLGLRLLELLLPSPCRDVGDFAEPSLPPHTLSLKELRARLFGLGLKLCVGLGSLRITKISDNPSSYQKPASASESLLKLLGFRVFRVRAWGSLISKLPSSRNRPVFVHRAICSFVSSNALFDRKRPVRCPRKYIPVFFLVPPLRATCTLTELKTQLPHTGKIYCKRV